MTFATPQLFSEAVKKLGSRSVIGSQLNSSEWSDLPVGLRNEAFASSRVQSVRFLQDLRDGINDFLTGAREKVVGPDGIEREALKLGSKAEFVTKMRSLAIENGLGDLVPESKRGGLEDITSQRRLSLIFDIQTQQHWSFGNWKQGMQSDVLNEFPAWRFIREVDVVRERTVHALEEGTVRLKTDTDFWTAMNSPTFGGFGVPWGPWGFGSGMGVEDVDREEAEALGLIAPGVELAPADRRVEDQIKASTRNIDPDLKSWLMEKLGDQVEETEEGLRWKRQDGPSGTGPGAAPDTSPRPPSPVPPSNPVPTPAPRPSSEPPATLPQPSGDNPSERATSEVASAIKAAGLSAPEKANAESIAVLRASLQKDHELTSKDVVANDVAARRVRPVIDEFLRYLPAGLVQSLPKFTLEVFQDRQKRVLGSFNAKTKTLQVRSGLKGIALRETVFHELMHWVHLNGPKWYQDDVTSHWHARTQNEGIAPLPKYGVPGKKDRWYDPYAGRVYSHHPSDKASEVPTVHLQTLAWPDDRLAEMWKSADFRETMLVAMRILFA